MGTRWSDPHVEYARPPARRDQAEGIAVWLLLVLASVAVLVGVALTIRWLW
jgi:hypothetical protein